MGRAVTVKSEPATSMAAVYLGSSIVLAMVIIVVKYRLVYRLSVNYRRIGIIIWLVDRRRIGAIVIRFIAAVDTSSSFFYRLPA